MMRVWISEKKGAVVSSSYTNSMFRWNLKLEDIIFDARDPGGWRVASIIFIILKINKMPTLEL